jgi:hypothetical protein
MVMPTTDWKHRASAAVVTAASASAVPAAWLAGAALLAATVALTIWSLWLVPRLSFQPRGLDGALYAFNGVQHTTWNGVAIDAPDGYAIHPFQMKNGTASLVINEQKLPWMWPDTHDHGWAIVFAKGDTTKRRIIHTTECGIVQGPTCQTLASKDGAITCYLMDYPASPAIPHSHRQGDCFSRLSPVEIKFYSPRATRTPLELSVVAALDRPPSGA